MKQTESLHRVNGDYYFKISAVSNLVYQHKVTVAGLFIFERISAGKSHIEAVNPTRVVGDLFPVTLVDFNPASAARKFDFLIDLLSQIKCFKIYFGPAMNDFASAVEKCADQF